MIYIVRHGQTDWNKLDVTQGISDVSLNAIGIRQAELASSAIKDVKIDKIYSSDLDRAKVTAKIINSNFKYRIKIDERLREIDYGDIEGVPKHYVKEKDYETLKKYPKKVNAEPLEDVYKRIKDFFSDINLDEDILIVTHAGVLRMIIYYLEHPDNFNKELFVNEYSIKKVYNLSIYKYDPIKKEMTKDNIYNC